MPRIITPEQSEAFKTALRTETAQWNDTIPPYTNEPGSIGVYDEMGDILLARMRHITLPEYFHSSAISGGMAVIPRFMYAGGAKAALAGLTIDQLHSAMYTSASFNTLSLLTREKNKVATRIELALGLKRGPYESVDDRLAEYKIDSEEGLSIPRYHFLRDSIREELFVESEGRQISAQEVRAENPILCEGHQAGLVATVYRSMLHICLQDAHLYPATLARI